MAKKKQDSSMFYIGITALFLLAALTFFFNHYVIKSNIGDKVLGEWTGFNIAFGKNGSEGEVFKYGIIFLVMVGAAAAAIVGMLLKAKGNLFFLIAGVTGAVAVIFYCVYFFDSKNYSSFDLGGLVEGAKTFWFWLGFILCCAGTALSFFKIVKK